MILSSRRIFLIITSGVVGTAITAGLYLAGSPAAERLRQLDEIRIQHLRNLSAAVDSQIERNNPMPSNLASAIDGQRLAVLPVDPESGAHYEFAQLDSSSYHLCAVFSAASTTGAALDFWAHPAGRTCFVFQIDANIVLP